MKFLTLITTLSIVFTMQSCAQKSEEEKVPEKVLNAFKQKFPEAKIVECEMEGESEWEAGFKLNGKEYSSNFNTDGEWIETGYEIDNSEIPTNILSLIDQNFSEYEIEEFEIIESPSGKSYKAELEIDEKEVEVLFDSQGNIITKRESEED